MSNHSTILHKRSVTPGAVPVTLNTGELAMNVNDGILFIKNVADEIDTFSSDRYDPFVLDTELSGCAPQNGGNTISQVFSNVLGGYNNDVSGAGSTTVNGENNDIQGDFGFIGCGADNKILATGDFSAILGGRSNAISHENCFALGSNLSSHAANFTYVNNISGTFWGDATNLYAPTLAVGISSAQIATTGFVYNSLASGSYVTLSATQTLTNKTVVDWMGLVRGYKTTPVLNATIASGTVYTYVYTSSPSDKTYYRFIATDGSEDSFYASFNGTTLSNLVARKAISI
jgi:hypothetical protein